MRHTNADIDGRPNEAQLLVAQQLAEDIRLEPHRRWSQHKVTSLLSRFGAYRLSPHVRADMQSALRAKGLSVEPPLEAVRRSDSVRLKLMDPPQPDTARAMSSDAPVWGEGFVTARACERGKPPRLVGLAEDVPPTATVWYDVDVHAINDAKVVFDVLSSRCEGLTDAMVIDLFKPDDLPKVVTYDAGDVRAVSAVYIEALDELPGGMETDADLKSEQEASKAGALVCQLAELVAGRRWIITAWHEPHLYVGANPDPRRAATLSRQADVASRVSEAWTRRGLEGSGDLGLATLQQIAQSYVLARRQLYSSLDTWDHAFYDCTLADDSECEDRQTLIDLRRLLTEFRQRVTALDQAGEAVDSQWFCNVKNTDESARLDRLLKFSMRDLRDLAAALRVSFDLLATTSAARQLKLTERNQRLAEDTQRALGVVGYFLLAPTLMATVLAVNLKNVPFSKTESDGLLVLLVSLVLAALIGHVFIARALRRRPFSKLHLPRSTTAKEAGWAPGPRL